MLELVGPKARDVPGGTGCFFRSRRLTHPPEPPPIRFKIYETVGGWEGGLGPLQS